MNRLARAASLLVLGASGCAPPEPEPAASPDPPATDAAPAAAATDPPAAESPPGDSPGSADSTYWRTYFTGVWTGGGPDEELRSSTCQKVLAVYFDSTQVMCVESNQIWITARWTLDAAAGRAHLLLVDPEDVGAGGARLPWDEMDRTAPLATLSAAPGEGRSAELAWYGFRTHAGEEVNDDLGSWYAGDYVPADRDARLPDAR